MTRSRRSTWALLLAAIVLIGMGGPAMAISSNNTGSLQTVGQASQEQTPDGNNSGVNVTVGPQLSTIIAVSSDQVQTEFENIAFAFSVERGDESERAEELRERAEELHERAEDIQEDYEEATEAYNDGELTKSEYAQRLATLNARASNLLESYEQFRDRLQDVNESESEALGINTTALNETIENLDNVSGSGTAALLRHFTGESEGEIEIETANGLEIEVESEDGEFSREFERPGDDDDSVTINHSAALESARSALSTPENGSWILTESKVDDDDGVYEFEFELQGADGFDGEAEVEVDGSSGEVVSLEEEIEPSEEEDGAEGDDDEDEEDDDDDEEQDEDEEDDEDDDESDGDDDN